MCAGDRDLLFSSPYGPGVSDGRVRRASSPKRRRSARLLSGQVTVGQHHHHRRRRPVLRRHRRLPQVLHGMPAGGDDPRPPQPGQETPENLMSTIAIISVPVMLADGLAW